MENEKNYLEYLAELYPTIEKAAVQHDLVPVIDILLLLFLHLQALSRVIDKGCKRTFFRNTERVAEDIVNLLSHGTGTVAEYMRKGFVFAMNIRKEMLRAFGKVDNGLPKCGKPCRRIMAISSRS